MRRDLSALLVAVLLVAGFSAAAVAVNNAGSSTPAKHSYAEVAKDGHPPPWAHGGEHGVHGKQGKHGKKEGRGADKRAWKKYWHNLTPAQRAAKMAELAQAHADEMKKFAACVKAAGDDKSKIADCEKPLPPGLAKKRLH